MAKFAVAKVESCTVLLCSQELWKVYSETDMVCFQFRRNGYFLLFLLSLYSPGGQHDVYTVQAPGSVCSKCNQFRVTSGS